MGKEDEGVCPAHPLLKRRQHEVPVSPRAPVPSPAQPCSPGHVPAPPPRAQGISGEGCSPVCSHSPEEPLAPGRARGAPRVSERQAHVAIPHAGASSPCPAPARDPDNLGSRPGQAGHQLCDLGRVRDLLRHSFLIKPGAHPRPRFSALWGPVPPFSKLKKKILWDFPPPQIIPDP